MAKAEASKEIRRKQLIDATMRAIGRYGYASLTLTHDQLAKLSLASEWR